MCDSETQLYVKQLEANAKCAHSVDNEKTKNHRNDVTSESALVRY